MKEKKGTIRERDGKFYFRTYVTLSNGNRKQVERLGGTTWKQAERAMIKFQLEYENKHLTISTKMLFFDFLDKFIEDYSVNWNGNTLQTVTNYFKIVKKEFENIKINKLTTYYFQSNFNNLSKKYSKKTLSNLKGFISNSLNYGIDIMKIFPENYISNIKISGKESKKTRAYTKEELILIKSKLQTGRNLQYYYLFRILLETGARIGEILALKWENIDFINKTINIEKSLYFHGSKPILNSKPKNKYSIRTILIPNSLINILTVMKQEYENNRIKYNEYFNDTNHIFTRPNGDLPSYSIETYFNKVLRELVDIPNPTHSLRHTHITHLIEKGVNLKAIQERVGHNDIRTTLNIYTHITKDEEKKLVNTINFF